MDKHGDLVVGTSTSGWAYKPSGRIGDSPMLGCGLFLDNEVGAAAATGDGEDIMKAAVCTEVVLRMRAGATPTEACRGAVEQMRKGLSKERRKDVMVGVVALSKAGEVKP